MVGLSSYSEVPDHDPYLDPLISAPKQLLSSCHSLKRVGAVSFLWARISAVLLPSTELCSRARSFVCTKQSQLCRVRRVGQSERGWPYDVTRAPPLSGTAALKPAGRSESGNGTTLNGNKASGEEEKELQWNNLIKLLSLKAWCFHKAVWPSFQVRVGVTLTGQCAMETLAQNVDADG